MIPGELTPLSPQYISGKWQRDLGPEDGLATARGPDFFLNWLSKCLLQSFLCFLCLASCANAPSWLCIPPGAGSFRVGRGAAHAFHLCTGWGLTCCSFALWLEISLPLWDLGVAGGIGVGVGTGAPSRGHYLRIRLTTFSPPKLNHTQMACEAVASHIFGGNPK